MNGLIALGAGIAALTGIGGGIGTMCIRDRAGVTSAMPSPTSTSRALPSTTKWRMPMCSATRTGLCPACTP